MWLDDRAVVRLSGDDVRAFVQGLVTQDVTGPLPVHAGLLSAQGKALFDFLVWDDGADLLIDCEAAVAADLVRRLTLYRLRRAIVIAVDPACGVHWAPDGTMGAPDPRGASLGRRWIGAADGVSGSAAFRAHRLGAGVVEGRAELGYDQTLWLETNALARHGVSFTKGCYVGQENTARMYHRDKIRRVLTVAPIDAPGEAIVAYPDLGWKVVRG